MKITTLLCTLGLALAFFGTCAGTQETVVERDSSGYTQHIRGSQEEIYNATRLALRKHGFSTTFSDKNRGLISTRPKEHTLSKKECSCDRGSSFEDGKITVSVILAVTMTNGSITMKSTIYGENPSTHKTFQCASKDSFEKELVRIIQSYL